MLMLFLAPVAWVHNFSLFILPLAFALAAAFSIDQKSYLWHIGLITFGTGILLTSIIPVLEAFGVFLLGALILWTAFLFTNKSNYSSNII